MTEAPERGANPLLEMLRAAAGGRFPPADGLVEVLPSPPGPTDAVVAFAGHHVVAAGVGSDEVHAHLDPDDIASAMRAPFLTWLGDRLGARVGLADATLAAFGVDTPPPVALRPVDVDDVEGNERVDRARRFRTDLRVLRTEDGAGVLIVGRGLAGRMEASFEVDPASRSRGLGRALAMSARSMVPAREPLFVQVTPGNAASLRAVLAAGYRPIGGEAQFLRRAPAG
jgi:GNAT superfamily N-acetyltransferase